jgi:metal-dependent HD superfamily phosphatase/phosphodiesterase
LTSEVLHAIISHRSDGRPLTVEAGIVRVADALDMSEGRTRFPYQEGKVDIHSVSALAIDDITIKAGRKTPVQVDITMNHTAGIFQVDELLKKKVMGSGIEKYLEIKIFMDKGQGKQLFKDFYQG